MSNLAIESHSGVPKRRWKIAWLLALGVLISYFDRINLSISHGALITTFAISNVTYGYLSAAYNWTYMLCQVPVGVLLDKLGVRVVSRISILIWSAASFGAGVTPNLSGFFGARFLLGIGEAPLFPSSAKAVGLWFRSKERSMATGLYDSASKFSNVVGVPLLGYLLIRFGWRWTFATTGILSLLYFILFYRVYRDPKEDTRLSEREREYILEEESQASAAARSIPKFSTGSLFRQPKVIGIALGSGSYNYIFYLLLTWLPSYLTFQLHIRLMDSFLYTAVPWLVATVGDIFVGGWTVDKLIARGWNADRVRRFVLLVGTAMGLGIVGAAGAHSAAQAVLWISISIGGLSSAAAIIWTVPTIIAPPNNVGTVAGIMNLSNQISGIAAPIVTGYVVAAFHSYAWAFGIGGLYLLVGIAADAFLLGRIEMIPLRNLEQT